MKLLLGKLIATQYVPDSFSSEEIGEFISVKGNMYQIFTSGNVGDIVEDNTNYSCGEYSYNNRKWELIQEVIPVK